MTTALAILATAAVALAVIAATTRHVIREARAYVAAYTADDEPDPATLAAVRPALAVIDYHQQQLRRRAETDPTAAAALAADLADQARRAADPDDTGGRAA